MIPPLARKTGFWLRQLALEAGLSIRLAFEPLLRRAGLLDDRRRRALASQFPPLNSLAREIDLRIFAANDLVAVPRKRAGAESTEPGAAPPIPLP